jgi:hypothetical protein
MTAQQGVYTNINAPPSSYNNSAQQGTYQYWVLTSICPFLYHKLSSSVLTIIITIGEKEGFLTTTGRSTYQQDRMHSGCFSWDIILGIFRGAAVQFWLACAECLTSD